MKKMELIAPCHFGLEAVLKRTTAVRQQRNWIRGKDIES